MIYKTAANLRHEKMVSLNNKVDFDFVFDRIRRKVGRRGSNMAAREQANNSNMARSEERRVGKECSS